MDIKLPIVVVTYNRPESLQRLLGSIANAYFPHEVLVELIISVDFSDNNDCLNVANNFDWKYGEKKVIKHSENLGLRNQIISCGNIALQNDGVIILEDDCFVAKDFYNYAIQAFHFYKNDAKIAGISLYSYQFNENIRVPFESLKDGNDVYFMQIPSSLGQLWTKNQWKLFVDYYNFNPVITQYDKLPENVNRWSEKSWKKYFYKYMVERDLYFVYPQVSLSTNFCEIGENYSRSIQLFQVSINFCNNFKYKFISLSESNNIYDAYFEILPNCLLNLGFEFEYPFTVDTYLTKQASTIDSGYVITTYQVKNPIKKYAVSLKPLINNIIYKTKGEGLYLVHVSEYDKTIKHNNLLEIFRNQNPVPFDMGYEYGYIKGQDDMKVTRTFRLGRMIISIFDFRKWINLKTK